MIKYSSPIFFFVLVFLCISFLILSISLLPHNNFHMDIQSVTCNSEGTAGVCRMEGEEAWGDAYSSLIPVWIRNVWMKAQLMHTNNTV